ncbi:hypothetical protein TNCT_173391 [Trichonephila clavata]|uniref:Uncharacterized protein n=1 Tax=Trichonephila clavata TaxID=2740835 RepID=A0A8X6KH95_TRICU|nr:hypothetical protein TNCT_173391 [Trichonephila clavata]
MITNPSSPRREDLVQFRLLTGDDCLASICLSSEFFKPLLSFCNSEDSINREQLPRYASLFGKRKTALKWQFTGRLGHL